MFGLNKIKEAQKKAEEMKSTLAQMQFEGESLNGMAKAICNGSKEVSHISINESIFKIRPKEEVEQMVIEAINEALSKADVAVKEKMTDILPPIPGLKF